MGEAIVDPEIPTMKRASNQVELKQDEEAMAQPDFHRTDLSRLLKGRVGQGVIPAPCLSPAAETSR